MAIIQIFPGKVLSSDARVSAFAIFIASNGDQAEKFKSELPLGKGKVVCACACAFARVSHSRGTNNLPSLSFFAHSTVRTYYTHPYALSRILPLLS